MEGTEYRERIEALADRAHQELESFELPASPPDEEQAMEFLRSGVGPAVGIYIDAHTGGDHVRFLPRELELLGRAMNDWLALYTRCYGVRLECEFSIREVAALVMETHNIKDTAQLLTHVPASPSEWKQASPNPER